MGRFSFLIFSLLVFLPISESFGWDGYDYDSGSYIEIERGNLVRPGEEIEYYDYGSGEYKYGTVESIDGSGSSVDLEVYEYDSGEYRTFDMD